MLMRSSTHSACGVQTWEETVRSDLTELHLWLFTCRTPSWLEPPGGSCLFRRNPKVCKYSFYRCTDVCCQLYSANLQTGIRAEQLDISLFLYFLFLFFFSLVNLFVYYANLAFVIMIV